MRNKIIHQIHAEMKNDKSIFFLTADMGINLVENIQNDYPDRFLNVGIAEQNLIGVASGLINIGFKVVVYTISNFLVHRCFEQLRNDISLHKKPIVMIGTSCGYDNAPLGPTHHVIDDWGYIKNLPNFEIYCPSNISFCENLFVKLININKAIYLRIPKGGFNKINGSNDFQYIKGSSKNIFLTYGALTEELYSVNEKLNQSLLIFNKLHPIDSRLIINILKKYQNIYVAEDHFGSNGLYDSICKLIVAGSFVSNVKSLAPKDYDLRVGLDKNYFFQTNKIDYNSVKTLLKFSD
jgi:transketolase